MFASRFLSFAIVGETFSAWCFLAEIPVQEPFWAVLRELGSFGLVAFLIWYFVKFALPQQRNDYIGAEERQRAAYLQASESQRAQYIKASAEQRADFLAANGEMRKDFVVMRGDDRQAMRELAAEVGKLARATSSHVEQAEKVWTLQEEQRQAVKAELDAPKTKG